ncbi:MAG: FAD-dependent oxidoreductase [Dehalococcoidales bacterium]|nr:FAD-dependent oxidoreductase [Dehalococcoidales bacterium]
MYDLIIIGGGPAGLTAAVYAARKRINTLLITNDIGGQVNWTTGIENYMGYQFIEGAELISKFEAQVNQFPIDRKIGQKVTGITKTDDGFEITTESDKFQSKAVLLVTGKRPRHLNIPGETELTGRGVTYCAICDGPVFAGQKVAVIGGGNSALEATLDMVKIAEHVDLISLTPLTGDPVLIEKLSDAKNLSVFLEHQPEEISGKGLVEGIAIKDLRTGERKHLDVSGIFIEIGLVPNSDMVKGLVKLNQYGEVPVNCSCETETPGLFAAGDVTTVPEKQIVVAAGEGAKAALQAHRYLQRLAK